MKIKKTLITFLVIVIVCIFSLPSALFANGQDIYEYTVTVEKTSTGFDSGKFTFLVFAGLFFPLASGSTIGYGDESVQINFSFYDLSGIDVGVLETDSNGATGVKASLNPSPKAIDGELNLGNIIVTGITLSPDDNEKTVYFDNLKVARPEPEPKPEPEPEVWVRPMPMTCWQVWINEDNDFQFIFWYPYKDNNWVRIYDMEDNMVFEVDLPLNDPNLIVDLPDGYYMVRTYHGEVMLQEFLIGKP